MALPGEPSMRILIHIAAALFIASPSFAGGTPSGDNTQVAKFRYQSALTASREAVGRRISDWRFTDAGGMTVAMEDLRGRPLVVSLVFTSCHAVCPTTTRYLDRIIDKARDTLGQDDFRVALIGFDHANDSPLAMKQYAKSQGVEDAGWLLLSADADTISGFTREVGFSWFTSPSGFDHITQVTVLDGDGVVYRQVYGDAFGTRALVDPLMELVYDRRREDGGLVDDLVTRVRAFCTAYDPVRDAYYFDYSLFIGMIIGGSIILATIAVMIREVRVARRQRQG